MEIQASTCGPIDFDAAAILGDGSVLIAGAFSGTAASPSVLGAGELAQITANPRCGRESLLASRVARAK